MSKDKIEALKFEIKELEEKVERFSSMEQAVKIVLNSGYGAIGAPQFRWYDETIAEGITTTGQIAIRYISKKINEFINKESDTIGVDYILSSDTDSTYVGIESVVKKKWPDITDKQKLTDLIDDYAENVLGTYIEECYNKLSEYLNCDINLLDMKREAIADTFIIRAKKNYIMRIYDNEGIRFADPYYKMMGIEVVRTSHPIMVRDALEEALKIVIDGTNEELRSFVSKFKDEFMSAPLNKIGSPRGVSDVTKYSTDDHRPKEFEMVLDESGKFVKKKVVVPIHVTAAINYNRLVSEKKLSNRYEYIRNGSKIKFLPLKEPNPLKSHVIGFVDVMPEEFEISEYIDKESHWEKIFVKPLETFLIYNGWTIEENTLVDLFGDSIDIAKAAIGIKKQSKKKEAKQVSSLF